MLGDLLALVSDEDEPLIGGSIDIALELGEADARRGAEVWDELTRIERDKFYDAEVLDRAHAFETAYLERNRNIETPEPVGSAWIRWNRDKTA
jgi:hypothetical protein